MKLHPTTASITELIIMAILLAALWPMAWWQIAVLIVSITALRFTFDAAQNYKREARSI